jgi:hypothetical protein
LEGFMLPVLDLDPMPLPAAAMADRDALTRGCCLGIPGITPTADFDLPCRGTMLIGFQAGAQL